MKITALVGALVLWGGLAMGLRAEVPGQKGAEYLGAKKCKMCHMKQYKTWESTKHSKNFSALQGDEKKDAKCLACHTTGFGKGGYDLSKDDAYNENFENTQCESCHGPGGNHMKAKKEDKKAAIDGAGAACTGCHNPHKNFGEEAKAARGQ